MTLQVSTVFGTGLTGSFGYAFMAMTGCAFRPYGTKSSERGNVTFSRSLYFVRPLKAGDVITADAIRPVRPGLGAAPRHFDAIPGQCVRADITANSPVRLDQIDS